MLIEPEVAEPPLRATAPPKFAPSILNCTVPVGVPALEVTVAVKVTGAPKAEGFEELVTLVVVAAFATVTVSLAALHAPATPLFAESPA